MPKVAGDDNDLLEDSDEQVSDNDENAETEDDTLAEHSDNEDLLPFNGLIEYDGSEEEEDGSGEEWRGIGATRHNNKRKRGEEERSGFTQKTKRRKSLPTFANYEDYAKMIEDGQEANL
jgi:ribosome biogenesis protein MAK21